MFKFFIIGILHVLVGWSQHLLLAQEVLNICRPMFEPGESIFMRVLPGQIKDSCAWNYTPADRVYEWLQLYDYCNRIYDLSEFVISRGKDTEDMVLKKQHVLDSISTDLYSHVGDFISMCHQEIRDLQWHCIGFLRKCDSQLFHMLTSSDQEEWLLLVNKRTNYPYPRHNILQFPSAPASLSISCIKPLQPPSILPGASPWFLPAREIKPLASLDYSKVGLK